MKIVIVFLLIACIFIFPFDCFSSKPDLLIFPFENLSSNQKFFWIGESIALSLRKSFARYNFSIVSKKQMEEALKELGLPFIYSLSRASMIRVAELVGAKKIINGEFTLEDGKILITARFIDLEKGKLGEVIPVKGDLDALIMIQNLLAWDILKKENVVSSKSKEDFINNRVAVPLHAYENYIKGVISQDIEKKISFFKRAFLSFPGYSEAAWELAKIYYFRKDYKKCNYYLEQVVSDKSFHFDALFLKAICLFDQGKFKESREIFTALLDIKERKAIVSNNIGVCLMHLNRIDEALYFFKSSIKDKEREESYFNLALASYLKNELIEAEKAIKSVLLINPRDKESHLLLIKILKKLGKKEIKEIEEKIFSLYFSSHMEDFKEDAFPFRIINPFTTQTLATNEYLFDFYYQEAENLMRLEKWAQAKQILNELLYIQPYNKNIYHLMGKVDYKQSNYTEAVRLLYFSLWLGENEETRFLLVKSLLGKGEKAKARAELEKLLTINPSHKQALNLYKKFFK